jgi:hypothetical protein
MAGLSVSTPFEKIKNRFAQHNDLEVLSHCLGIKTIHMDPTNDTVSNQTRKIANKLAEHTVVICIDTEHWTLNSDEMTEIGITMLHTQDVLEISRTEDFGDHGFNILEQATFHFFRLSEKTHLPTSNFKSRGPEGNSFGHIRFVTFAEARTILKDLLVQPITDVDALCGHNCPIVVLGHSVGHDREHLNGKDLGFDMDTLGTVARVIDTQKITIDGKHWFGSKDPIGLRTLVQKLEFHHTNSHTAANDAARTFIAGVLMTIPKEARQGCRYNTQTVVHDLEKSSRENFIPLGGVKQYCCLCGDVGHMADVNCKKYGRTLKCDQCISRGLDMKSRFHIELHCPVIRDEVAAERLAWYAGQVKEWKPKYPFVSRSRLQAFAPGAPKPAAATEEEVAVRRKWYDDQNKAIEPLKPFVWKGRSFEESPLFGQGPPPGQKVLKFRPVPTWPPSPSSASLPPRSDVASLRGNSAPRLSYGGNIADRGQFFPSPTGTGLGSRQQYSMLPAHTPGDGYFPPLGSSNNYQNGPAPGGFNNQPSGNGAWGSHPNQYQRGGRGRGRGRENGYGGRGGFQ